MVSMVTILRQRNMWVIITYKTFILISYAFYKSYACPRKCQCLEGGIVVCQNKYLLEIPNDFPNDTVHAYIGANFIRKIRKDAFKNTKLLKTLEVSSNFLREIEPGAFAHLRQLTTLTLKDNLLPGITKGMFQGLDNLQSLDLSDVSPEGVPLCIEDGSFIGLKNLETLNLDHNSMIGLTNFTLIGLYELKSLDLTQNNFLAISSGAFETFTGSDITFDDTIDCCCTTARAMQSIRGITNGRCLDSCSNDFIECQKHIISSCLLENPIPYEIIKNNTKTNNNAEDNHQQSSYEAVRRIPVKSRQVLKNISLDVEFQRQLSYIKKFKRNGVGLTRNEQWSIAITTCLVFIASVLLFLMAIYCKKKKFAYHMKCCTRAGCALNHGDNNNAMHEVNLMNKYCTAPNESHI